MTKRVAGKTPSPPSGAERASQRRLADPPDLGLDLGPRRTLGLAERGGERRARHRRRQQQIVAVEELAQRLAERDALADRLDILLLGHRLAAPAHRDQR